MGHRGQQDQLVPLEIKEMLVDLGRLDPQERQGHQELLVREVLPEIPASRELLGLLALRGHEVNQETEVIKDLKDPKDRKVNVDLLGPVVQVVSQELQDHKVKLVHLAQEVTEGSLDKLDRLDKLEREVTLVSLDQRDQLDPEVYLVLMDHLELRDRKD